MRLKDCWLAIDFLFIEFTGQKSGQDRRQRRRLRGHVTRNYLGRSDAEKDTVALDQPTGYIRRRGIPRLEANGLP